MANGVAAGGVGLAFFALFTVAQVVGPRLGINRCGFYALRVPHMEGRVMSMSGCVAKDPYSGGQNQHKRRHG
jgi:hypothetical protein